MTDPQPKYIVCPPGGLLMTDWFEAKERAETFAKHNKRATAIYRVEMVLRVEPPNEKRTV